MGNTKEKILETALEMFNRQGITISLRQIAAEAGISHGNLMYHFKTRQEIISQLHAKILQEAIEANQKLRSGAYLLEDFYQTTFQGFKILYKYRFFMIHLHEIVQEDPLLHKEFIRIEAIRSEMYLHLIHRFIDKGLMRNEEYTGEYDSLIIRIRIFSDFWISASRIYDKETVSKRLEKNTRLLMDMLYPYFTGKGKKEFLRLVVVMS